MEISARKTTPYLDFSLAWYLPIERLFVPEVALRVEICGHKKKTRPAKCQIDKAGGFSYNGFSGSDGNPNHEYMRTSSHTHRRIIIAINRLVVKVSEIVPSKKIGGFLWQKTSRRRNWAFVLYPESAPADWREQLKKLDCNVQSAHYMTRT